MSISIKKLSIYRPYGLCKVTGDEGYQVTFLYFSYKDVWCVHTHICIYMYVNLVQFTQSGTKINTEEI